MSLTDAVDSAASGSPNWDTVTDVNGFPSVIPIVILNWNGEGDTMECLKSIRKSASSGFVPLIVDNGSEPESVKQLKFECQQLYSRVLFLRQSELNSPVSERTSEFRQYLSRSSLIFIENTENVGFAKGSNLGIKFAQIVGSEWVMLLNNDTVVNQDTFQRLREFMATSQSFPVITPQIRCYNPATRIQNCGGDLTYFGSRKYRFANMDASALPRSQFEEVTFVTGCALLFKYTLTGKLSEDFFFGEEDYEFSLRMKKAGVRMACVHDAIVFHKGAATIRRSAKRLGNILIYYVNRLINVRNYYSGTRWQLTKLLAYAYLPVVLAKNGISPLRAFGAIWEIESFIRRKRGVNRAEFQSLIFLE